MEDISTFGSKMFRWPRRANVVVGSNNKIRNRIGSDVQRVTQMNRNGNRHQSSEMEKRCERNSRRIAICKNDGIDWRYSGNGTIRHHCTSSDSNGSRSQNNGITPLESKAMDLIELITNSYRSQGGFCWEYFLKILSFWNEVAAFKLSVTPNDDLLAAALVYQLFSRLAMKS